MRQPKRKVKLTDTYIGSLKAEAKRYKVWDTSTQGLLVEVLRSNKKMFRVYYKFGPKIRYFTIGTFGSITLASARDAAKIKLGEVVKGIDPLKEKQIAQKAAKIDKAIKLKTFLEDEYKPWVLANRKSGSSTLRTVEKNFDWLMDKRMDEITTWQINKWQTSERKRGLKPGSINRKLTSLRGVLSKAVQLDIIVTSPLSKVKNLQTDNERRVRYLTDAEETRLLNGLRARQNRKQLGRQSGNEWRSKRNYPLLVEIKGYADYFEPLVLVALNTGMRRGELFSLEWTHVNFDELYITVTAANAKSATTRHIPMNKTVYNVIKKWRSQTESSQYVFYSPQTGEKLTSLKSSWSKLLKTANIDSFRFHDCRHCFASKLVMKGVDLNTVRELLGHSDLKMTLRYSHLAPEHKAKAVSLLEVN